MLKVGVIGYGSRINDVLHTAKSLGDIKLVAVADKDLSEEKKSFIEKNDHIGVKYYSSAEDMLTCESLDGVFIGTRCSSHTEYMLLCAKYALPTFLEKPVCTTEDDLARLKSIEGMNDKVVVSFPLRYSDLVTYVKKLIDSGKIGRVQHIEAINNVPYGRVYYHKWYRDENETGGLFLQKSTHDLDYINYIIGDRRPVSVCAISSKQIFKGDKPAGMLCADCNETATCPESPQNVKTYGDNYPIGPYCCFAKDTGNQESGSVLVSYDDGMHVCYTQNFITRNGAARRGAIIVGYLGTIEFDFYTGQVKFFHHTDGNIETLDIKSTGLHHGGDGILAKNFIDVMENKDVSHATLKDGILSAELCLAAKRSARDRVFVNIEN